MGDTILALLSHRRRALEARSCDLDSLACIGPEIRAKGDFASPHLPNPKIASRHLRDEQRTREAVLLAFCDPIPDECSRLLDLSARDWSKLLRWLDLSGLALYFLDRLVELDLSDLLPPAVFTRLHLNLIDNSERTKGMINQSFAIQRDFLAAGLSYANLKGLSLWPDSVPRPELRSQFDLDFLVAEHSAPGARRILEDRGYRLYAISGRSWEFKLNERPGLSLKHLYKNLPSFSVELHIDSPGHGTSSQLDRLEWRELYGMKVPVLSPVDLLLGQGLHAYKHVCGEFMRAAHLQEFRRHVLARKNDGAFWNELERAAGDNPRARMGLGVVTLLITRVMGEFAPAELTRWSVNSLSRPVQLWVETYGHRIVFGSYPGSKLYLLLQRELEGVGARAKRSIRRTLLPSHLPPLVIRAFPNETWSVRIRRYSMQFAFVLSRFRFHLVEGIRFGVEVRRWRRTKELAL